MTLTPPTLCTALGLLALATACPWAAAQTKPAASAAGIYTCIDDQGRRLTSDRPIPACTHKEQRVLNRDGSLKTVKPPTLTLEERAEQEARDRKAAEARAAQADAVRRDRNLVARFPDQAAHDKARVAALDTVKLAIRASSLRLEALGLDRKPLLDEAEFYAGKPMPAALKGQLDANDASFAAQRSAMQTQEAELVRINKLYDAELAHLKRLWAGAAPGSLVSPAPAPAAASRPAR
ncbi:MAG: hypothetical protein IV093_17130 [Rubrivivax sp.]|nr:hypothetical protein [Rubrivivax sp.]